MTKENSKKGRKIVHNKMTTVSPYLSTITLNEVN
jgi:hypothetical protein